MSRYRITVTFTTIEEATTEDEAIELGQRLLGEGYWDSSEADVSAEEVKP